MYRYSSGTQVRREVLLLFLGAASRFREWRLGEGRGGDQSRKERKGKKWIWKSNLSAHDGTDCLTDWHAPRPPLPRWRYTSFFLLPPHPFFFPVFPLSINLNWCSWWWWWWGRSCVSTFCPANYQWVVGGGNKLRASMCSGSTRYVIAVRIVEI